MKAVDEIPFLRVSIFLLFSLDLFCLVVLRPLYQVILLTKLTAS